MKKTLETVGFVLASFGAAGVVHHFFEWFQVWGFAYRFGPLQGHQPEASVGLLVVGALIMLASDRVRG